MNRGAIDFHERREARPQPFLIRSAGEFEGVDVPRQNWLLPGVLIRGGITMLNGAGGIGKSLLLLQMQVAGALALPWLGIDIPDSISSFCMYCEDDTEEIHRRLHAVCKSYACSFADLGDKVRFACRVGEQNELMKFNFRNDAEGKTTQLYDQLLDEVQNYGTQLIGIDTVADTFGGNENIRPQARAFIGKIRRLALVNMGGVVLTAHPSRAGLADGSGLSGSTGWEGSVRCRIYLTKPRNPDKDVEGEDEPTDERVLKTMKSNYGPPGGKMRCRWTDGVFVRTDIPGQDGGIVSKLEIDAKVMSAAEMLFNAGSNLGADPKTGFAVLARKTEHCKGMTWQMVVSAQERLLKKGSLVKVVVGPKSRARTLLRPAGGRYHDEQGGLDV